MKHIDVHESGGGFAWAVWINGRAVVIGWKHTRELAEREAGRV